MSTNGQDGKDKAASALVGWGGSTFGSLGNKFRQQVSEVGAKVKAAGDKLQQELEIKNVDDATTPPATAANGTSETTSPTTTTTTTTTKNTTNTNTSTSLANRKPENVSKEELMTILAKMNKRLKTLNAEKTALSERVERSDDDRRRLVSLVTTEIVSEGDVETARRALASEKDASAVDDEVEVLRRAWVAADEGRSLVLQRMQTEYKSVRAAHEEEVAALRRAAEENGASSSADDPAGAAAALSDLREDHATQIEHMRDLLRKVTAQHEVDLRAAREEASPAQDARTRDLEAELGETRSTAQSLKGRLRQSEEARSRVLQTLEDLRVTHVEETHAREQERTRAAEEARTAHEEELERVRGESSSSNDEENRRLRERLEELEREAERRAAAHEAAVAEAVRRATEESAKLREETEAAHAARSEERVAEVRRRLESDFEERLTNARTAHAEELDAVRSESSARKDELDATVARLEERLETMEREHAETLRRSTSETESLASRLREESAASAAAAEDARKSLAEASAAAEDAARAAETRSAEARAEHERALGTARASWEEETKRRAAEHAAALVKVREDAAAETAEAELELERLRAEMADEIDRANAARETELREARAAWEREAEDRRKTEEADRSERARAAERESEDKIRKLREEHAAALGAAEEESRRSSEAHRAETERIRAEAAAASEAAAAEADRRTDERLRALREEAAAASASSAAAAEAEHAAVVRALRDEAAAAEDAAATARREASAARDDLERARAAAAEDAAALRAAAAAADGDSEEASTKQRETFEETLRTQRERHDAELKEYRDARDADAESARQLEKELTETRRRLEEAETAREKRDAESRVAEERRRENEKAATTASKEREERLEQRLRATQERLDVATAESRTASETSRRQLDDAVRARDDLESSVAALRQRLTDAETAKNDEIDALKSNYSAYIAEKEQDLENKEAIMEKLKASSEAINEESVRVQFQSENVLKVNGELKAELEETRRRLADAETKGNEDSRARNKELSDLRSRLTRAAETHKAETDKLAKDHEAAVGAKEKEINDLKTRTVEIKKKVAAMRDKFATEIEDLKTRLAKSDEIVQALRAEHATALETARKEAETALETRIAELAQTNETATKAMRETAASSEKELREQLRTALRERDEATSRRDESESALRDARKNFEAERGSWTATSREESAELAARLEREREAAIASLTEKHAQETETRTREHESRVAALRKELDDARGAAAEDLKAEYQKRLQTMEETHLKEMHEAQENNSRIEMNLMSKLEAKEEERHKMTLTWREERKAETNRLANDHEQATEALRKEHSSVLAKLRDDHSSALKAERDTAEAQLSSLADEHATALAAKDKEKALYTTKLKNLFEAKLQSTKNSHESSAKLLEAASAEKDRALESLRQELAATSEARAAATKARDDLEDRLRTKTNDEKTWRGKAAALEKELEESVRNSSTTAASLLEEQENLQSRNKQLTSELDAARKESAASRTQREESDGKIRALTDSLNATLTEKRRLEDKVEAGARVSAKLKSTEQDLASIRQQANRLTLDLTTSKGLVSRLQADKDASERKHGQRTALVGMLEVQVTELNEANEDVKAKLEATKYEIDQKNEDIAGLEERLRKAEEALVEAQNSRARKAASDSAQRAGDGAKKDRMIESLKRELQTLSQKMARKSSVAQNLLQEREAECAELRKTNRELQREVDSGSLSDRRIFELAARQSNRDSAAVSEIEIRERMLERFASALSDRDGELATAEHTVKRVGGQVEELARVRRREDVNIDYLKSIVVQFLSKPPGSSERAALLPVLATLLQFDETDYRAIEQGKQKISWLWGQISPTIIDREDIIEEESEPAPPVSTSQPPLEPSRSQRPAGAQHKRTSLQF